MIKKVCSELMVLSSYDAIRNDYSIVCFLHFLKDYKLYKQEKIPKSFFYTYLYRFYLDNEELRKKHFFKLINNIQKYKPNDFASYCDDILAYIAQKAKIIKMDEESIGLIYWSNDISQNEEITISRLIDMIVRKANTDTLSYTDRLQNEDFTNFKTSKKLFNRVLEKINYCFICEESEVENLVVIKLNEKEEYTFNVDNYLLLCKEDAELYERKELVIKKNGYAYLNGIRIYQHLEINVLKSIRLFL